MEKCTECGKMLPLRMDDREIMPCPACGSTCRTEDGIKEKITFKAKLHGRTGRQELEITLGDDFHRKEKNGIRSKELLTGDAIITRRRLLILRLAKQSIVAKNH